MCVRNLRKVHGVIRRTGVFGSKLALARVENLSRIMKLELGVVDQILVFERAELVVDLETRKWYSGMLRLGAWVAQGLSRFVLVSGAGVVEDVVGQRDHEWNVLETGVTERFLWFNLR